MSDTDLRRRNGVPVKRRSVDGPNHNNSSLAPPSKEARRRSGSQLRRRLPRPSTKPLQLFERCRSEPALPGAGEETGQRWLIAPDDEEVLFWPRTCTDIFLTSDYSSDHRSPRNFLQGYKKDAKVVISVTVEGSPGPVRAMVQLGCSVEETIKLVVDRYTEEGRTPGLDKDAIPALELHHSYFSLECLDKGDAIGDAGSRSFYLRKSGSCRSRNSSSSPDDSLSDVNQQFCSPIISFQSYVCKKINKIIRGTQKLWKLLGCVQ